MLGSSPIREGLGVDIKDSNIDPVPLAPWLTLMVSLTQRPMFTLFVQPKFLLHKLLDMGAHRLISDFVSIHIPFC
jgi:hypothetical protein